MFHKAGGITYPSCFMCAQYARDYVSKSPLYAMHGAQTLNLAMKVRCGDLQLPTCQLLKPLTKSKDCHLQIPHCTIQSLTALGNSIYD